MQRRGCDSKSCAELGDYRRRFLKGKDFSAHTHHTQIAMVTIALLGATGGCGSAFLKYALEAGHTVRAQARTPSKVTTKHGKLTVIKGDATSADDVAALCEGCEVAVSCAGSAKIMESLAKNLVVACEKHGIQRCYCVTSVSEKKVGVGRRAILLALLCNHQLTHSAHPTARDERLLTHRPDNPRDDRRLGKHLRL